MFRKILAPATLVAALALSGCFEAPESAEREESVSVTGVVRAIDKDARRFVVEGDNATIQYRVSDEVRNFDQLAVGDKIVVTYLEYVAATMADPEDSGDVAVDSFGERAPTGAKPGAIGGTVESLVVDFIDYNANNHVARIRMPDGALRSVTVPEEFRRFAGTRQTGDRVLVVIQKAVAVSVTPAQ